MILTILIVASSNKSTDISRSWYIGSQEFDNHLFA